MLDEMSITTHGAEETQKLAYELGKLLQAGDVVLLSGDLGAGKTTFSKGVAAGLGVMDEVTSPTYTLVAEYEGRIPLAHMDLYRLSAAEAALFPIDDYLEGDAAVLIEWPEEIAAKISDALSIHISTVPLPRIDERVIQCTAVGNRSWQLLDEWVKQWLS